MNVLDQTVTDQYALYHGDSAEVLRGLPESSVHLSVFSPPFMSLFTYSPTERDLGNSRTEGEFYAHFRFMIQELRRVTVPGRNCCVHVAQVPAMLSRDGWIGLKDFRGHTIDAFEAEGWIYHGEVCIDKDPQALRDGTPVLTPTGWTPVEELRVGDQVIGSLGAPTAIIDIPYRGIQPLYCVEFDDGSCVRCGPEHKWTVRTGGNAWHVLRTDELASGGAAMPSGRLRYEVPIPEAVQFAPAETDLPIHPRLLGALLADGNWAGQRAVSITKDKELVESLPLPPGHHPAIRPGSEKAAGRTATYGITCDDWHQNAVLANLRALGLGECRAWEKFIPDCYLFASIGERRDLLRGLLDGDGKIRPSGGVFYQTTSERLARGVAHLVHSLGGLARIKEHEGSFYGDSKQGRTIWVVTVRMGGSWCPFTLKRKSQHWTPNRRQPRRRIASIRKLGIEAPCTCISVAAENGLFVTQGFNLTHNSQAIRTKAKALLFTQLRKDASWLRPALADYILVFRKPGDNPVPIHPELTNDEWIEWARPIWYGIRESDTLNIAEAREEQDERHICPLQLGTIERCIRLWSNPGETVLSPFAGIGSEVYQAVKLKRRGVGIELKESYYQTACRNLRRATAELSQGTLFATQPVLALETGGGED